MATIRNVAAAAGVSVKTVSRVLNGSREVSSATRERVKQVIAELDYRPSALAQRLASGKTRTIGLVIPRDARYVFSHLYFADVLQGIGEALAGEGYDLLVHLGHDDTPYIELLRQQHVDGLILMSIPVDHPNLAGLRDGDGPCVFTCRIDAGESAVHWVDADVVTGAVLAVDHLAGLGHRRLGLVTGPESLLTAQFQRQGYQRALQRHGLAEYAPWVAHGDYTVETGEAITGRMLASATRPTGVICGDDMTAIGVIQAARAAGLRVPEDLSVIGFDDVVLARYAAPPLTTIRQDSRRKGLLAAETLLATMRDTVVSGGPPCQHLLPVELIVRGSTGNAPDLP